jgi:hypothetical protein
MRKMANIESKIREYRELLSAVSFAASIFMAINFA